MRKHSHLIKMKSKSFIRPLFDDEGELSKTKLIIKTRRPVLRCVLIFVVKHRMLFPNIQFNVTEMFNTL